MKIIKNAVAQIHYTLKNDEGVVLDSSRDREPLEYLHGNGNLISGLEAQLEGKEAGDSFTAVIPPAEGYGEYDERLIAKVPRSQFESEAPIEVGMSFQASTIGGPMIVRVTEISDDEITVDGNHELAGKTLHFDVEVVSVREATDEELIPQFAGGCGGGCSSCGGGCGGGDDCGCGGNCGSDDGGCGCSGGCCG